jgi:hypothetical protein
VEWIHLAQDMDRLKAVVNAVMNLRVLTPRSLLVTVTDLHASALEEISVKKSV